MDKHNVAAVLNDLIQINNDRIAGYEDAILKLERGYDNLEELFREMIVESKDYNIALSEEINRLDESVATGTSGAGKLYRAWLDVKAMFTGGEAKPILNTCETIESATQTAYEDALGEEGLTAEVHKLISQQKASLLDAHNKIKQLIEVAAND